MFLCKSCQYLSISTKYIITYENPGQFDCAAGFIMSDGSQFLAKIKREKGAVDYVSHNVA